MDDTTPSPSPSIPPERVRRGIIANARFACTVGEATHGVICLRRAVAWCVREDAPRCERHTFPTDEGEASTCATCQGEALEFDTIRKEWNTVS